MSISYNNNARYSITATRDPRRSLPSNVLVGDGDDNRGIVIYVILNNSIGGTLCVNIPSAFQS